MAVIKKTVKMDMVQVLVDHAFKAKLAAADKALRLVGDKIYADIYADHLKIMESLPAEYMDTSSKVRIDINGQTTDVRLSCAKRMAYRHSYWNYVAKQYRDDEPLIQELEAARALRNSISSEQKQAERQAEAILERCNTFQALWKTWPECHEVLKHFDQPTGAIHLPALPIPELNKTFGLPVGAKP